MAYTQELEEINFTWPRGDCGGDYSDNVIRVAPIQDRATMVSVFVHELGHHVDELEDLAERESLVKEKKDRGHLMDDQYSQETIHEYIACGFEVFYCGTALQKKKMKKSNPKLFNAIRWLHRKYQNR